jgi:quinol monooxygenase YgiN
VSFIIPERQCSDRDALQTDGDLLRYADQAAFDFHVQQEIAQALVKWLSFGGLCGAPKIWELEPIDGYSFTRPEVIKHVDPLLVFTELQYKPDTVSTTLPYWKAVFETTKNDELGALFWGLTKDPKEPDKLFVVHAYESQEYLMNVHAPSTAMQATLEHGKDIRIGINFHMLKVHGGFLSKDTK